MNELAIMNGLRKEAKLIARKKLYFAISVAFQALWIQNENDTKALKIAKTALHGDCECGECKSVASEIVPELMRRQALSLRGMFCITNACQEYKRAFGEFPEFAQFLVDDSKRGEEEIARFFELVDNVVEETDKGWAKLRKNSALGLKTEAPSFKEAAFGKDFIKMAESIKLKGEV